MADMTEAQKQAQEIEKARDAALVNKAKEISALPTKAQRASATLAYEQQQDADHVRRVQQAEEAAAQAEKDKADAEKAAAEAVEIIGKSKDALLGRIKARHDKRFSHELSIDPDTGDLIILSLVKLDDSERPRRVSTARRIPKAEHEEMSRDAVAALEVEQLHVLAQRLGV